VARVLFVSLLAVLNSEAMPRVLPFTPLRRDNVWTW